MAKVVQLTGARPGGWAKERWAWFDAVTGDGNLSTAARLIAATLVVSFANHESGECRPGLAALVRRVASSRATVMRALAELQAAGWLARQGGNAPGKAAAYTFRRPEQVSEVRREQVSVLNATGLNSEISPCTPYKDKPQLNHNARLHPKVAIRGLPQPRCLTHIIGLHSPRAAAWDEWLTAQGFPPLAVIGQKTEGGYRMPVSVAPSGEDETTFRIALKWAEWLKSRA